MATTDELTNKLLERFKSLAVEHAQASEHGDYNTANRAVELTAEVIREMWITGGRIKDALRPLTELASSDDPRIALKAIIYTAELFPEVASQLSRLSREKSLIGLGAQYARDNFAAGKIQVLKEILGSDIDLHE